MKKTAILLVLVALVLAIIWKQQESKTQPEKSGGKQANPTVDAPAKTEVIKYRQTEVPAKSQSGDCFTGSLLAGSNSKAWRCFSENQLYDPCWETETGRVVCDANTSPGTGFELQLTKALPKDEANSDTGDIPYLLVLENGLTCAPFGGPAGEVAGESFYISCGQNSVIIGQTDPFPISQDGMWQAKVAYLDKTYTKIEKIEIVNISKVWE